MYKTLIAYIKNNIIVLSEQSRLYIFQYINLFLSRQQKRQIVLLIEVKFFIILISI